ncbi:MAG: ribosome biogenesis GTPase Der [bacterium]|nr:ribosome biogenesis GTPase Der [bacterium]
MTTLAILGRPNVGKSTLFNRLIGKQKALVDETPGVTRDRQEGRGSLGDLDFSLVDTAGFEGAKTQELPTAMWAQSKKAAEQADLVLFVIDGREGLIPLEEDLMAQLRPLGKKIILVANKCEGGISDAVVAEAHKLGLGAPVPISAAHGQGLQELFAAVMPHVLPPEEIDTETEEGLKALQLVILGRPNAGKSTLVNGLLKDERVLTGPEAGLTRDAIAIDWNYGGRPLRLVDTAGLRRKSRVQESLERLSTKDALRSMKFAHVVVLVLDATHPLEKQDLILARRVIEEGRSLVLGLNKWDQIPGPERRIFLREINEKLETTLPQVSGIPVVPFSAKEKRGLDSLMDQVFRVYDVWNRRVPTAKLNQWLENALSAHPLPLSQGRRLRLKYMTQIKSRPPTFAIFASKPGEIPDSYQRYLINGLRETFDLPAVPLRIVLKSGKNPYTEGK